VSDEASVFILHRKPDLSVVGPVLSLA